MPSDYIPPRAIEAIAKDQLIEVGNGEYVATVGAHPDLARDDETNPDGTWKYPSQPGDVLSVQEDGRQQTRPQGTAGNFERSKIEGAMLVYRPVGERTFKVPLASDWPNQ